MNNRYLYRAKRADNGEWIIGNLVYSENASIGYEYMIMPTQIIGNWSTVLKDTICQCTSLKDKNGKDIYEGDILRKSGCWDVRVEFERGQFCIKGADIVQYLNNTINGSIRNFPVDEYEVIGNIYENQDLLGN